MSEEIGWYRETDVTLASPETVIAVEGLDLAGEGPYRMIVTLVNPTDERVRYALYFNGDREDAHYWRQFLLADGEEIRAGRRNLPRIAGMEPGAAALVEGTLEMGADGLARAHLSNSQESPDSIMSVTQHIAWTIPENVTKVEVVADVESAIGPGSRLILMNTGERRI